MAVSNTRLRWFFINLDRSPDRRAEMVADMRALGVEATRVAAIDGAALQLPLPGIDPDRYRTVHGRVLRSSEVGCYLSHIRVMQAFLAQPHEYAVILEDDVILNRDTADLVEELTASGAPDDWDMVKFEAHHKGMALPLRRLGGAYRLCALPTRSQGSAAYLVNRKTAAAFIERLLPMLVPYDHAFDRGWAMGLRMRAIVPWPIGTRPGVISTITDSPARKVRLYEKLPTLMWRTKTETMRFLSALYAWAAPTRRFPWAPRPRPGSDSLVDQLAPVLADGKPRV